MPTTKSPLAGLGMLLRCAGRTGTIFCQRASRLSIAPWPVFFNFNNVLFCDIQSDLFMNNLRINHVAVWVCVIIVHALGFLWYGPLFGEKWMAFVGYDQESMQEDSMNPAIWVLNSVAIIAPIYLLAWLFIKLNIVTGIRGALIALAITFCFHHLGVMNANMFAGQPYGLAWITGGYVMTGLTISGFILGAWTKRNH
jgi:hypothetical protein